MSKSDRPTVLVTAYAKAPQGTAMYEVYKHAGVVLEVDPESGTIVDAEFTLVTDLARSFFKRMVAGHNLRYGFDQLLDEVRSRYFAPSVQALISALRGAHVRFVEQREKDENVWQVGTGG